MTKVRMLIAGKSQRNLEILEKFREAWKRHDIKVNVPFSK